MREKGVYANEMENWNVETVASSCRLHDVGKIAVSDVILNKPGKLTPDEYTVMQKHASEGEQIVNRIIAKTWEADFLAHARLFAGYHHERWDGNGYPRGLKGFDIPLEGRLMAITDVYDALVSKRPYKPPFSKNKAKEIIKKETGFFFDPAIAQIFFELIDKE
jgi:putative two-component system response regulator